MDQQGARKEFGLAALNRVPALVFMQVSLRTYHRATKIDDSARLEFVLLPTGKMAVLACIGREEEAGTNLGSACGDARLFVRGFKGFIVNLKCKVGPRVLVTRGAIKVLTP